MTSVITRGFMSVTKSPTLGSSAVIVAVVPASVPAAVIVPLLLPGRNPQLGVSSFFEVEPPGASLHSQWSVQRR
jgi:hypothetical protein